MMYGNNGMGGWAMALMGVGNLLFWGLLIVGVVFLVRPAQRGGLPHPAPGHPAAAPAPQQLLAERFARGEIDEEDYSRRLTVLKGTAPTDNTDG